MSKHTPGPWIPNRFDPSSPMTVVAESGEWVCKVSSSGMWANQTPETEDANAQLIAAAPDLLAALEALLPYAESEVAYHEAFADIDEENAEEHRESQAAIDKARAAIARAQGVQQ